MLFGHTVTYKIIDKGLIEYIGPTGISLSLSSLTKTISSAQSGVVYNYAFAIFLATTILLVLLSGG
jgi:hypothetical protein